MSQRTTPPTVPIAANGPDLHDPFYALTSPRARQTWQSGRIALITIDLQILDAHPDGWMGRLAEEQNLCHVLAERWEGIERIIPTVAGLQAAFRGARQEVIHVRTGFRTRDHRDAGLAYMPDPKSDRVQRTSLDDEFLPAVTPVGDEMVFTKTTSSAFNSTDLDDVLRRMGIQSIILTGIVTDGCVELTARDAADRGYDVTLVSDGCSASRRTTHEAALQRMTEGGFIAGLTAAQTRDQLRRVLGAV
ncbi:MAG: isochorismatase family cysteine hydrolase [Candidatus Dormiibacterota bacterium]